MASEETTNFYHPEDSEGGEPDSLPARRKEAAITWTASEFIDHERGAGWYAALAAITAVLAAGAYFLVRDTFATAIVVIMGIILAAYANHPPRKMNYEVNSRSLKVGERDYSYSLFRSFSIVHEGALSTITFYPLKRVALPISIFFDAKDEKRITNLIGDHLPLEDRGPDRFDDLTRRLKI